jgi:hypothetical protein
MLLKNIAMNMVTGFDINGCPIARASENGTQLVRSGK